MGAAISAANMRGYPFHVCRALYQDRDHPGLATLYLQSCSGGIYEDDRLDLTLATAQGAEAHVSTQAATVVHSMPSGSATQRVRIQCEGGSYLEYLPDPQILFPGSRCRSEIAVRLGGDAVALVSDSFLTHDPSGRDGKFASYFSEIVVEDETGKALAIDRLKVDGQAFRELMSRHFRALQGARNDDRRRSRLFRKRASPASFTRSGSIATWRRSVARSCRTLPACWSGCSPRMARR